MEATKAALNITIEILKFVFTVTIAIGTAIAYLLAHQQSLDNANEFLSYCYFIVGVIVIALIIIIFAILALLNKLKRLEN
ncbi:MAG: hypothetical protein ACO1N7_10305 [Sphingobacteriaceae bacterium]